MPLSINATNSSTEGDQGSFKLAKAQGTLTFYRQSDRAETA